MLQLIKKDMAIHKLSWLIYSVISLVYMFAGNDIIFIIALMSAIIIVNVFYADERANGHKLWNAMPFTRREIVSARYMSLIIIIFFNMLLVMTIELVMAGGLELAFWKEVIGSFILILITSALFIPILYSLAQQNAVFILYVLYILLVIGAVYLFYYFYLYLTDNFIIPQTLSNVQFFSFGIVFSICLYILSCVLSVKIYKNKVIT